MNRIVAGDASMLGDAYLQWGRFEAKVAFNLQPGGLNHVEVPPGFAWQIEPSGRLVVTPKWWRRLLYRVTGKWQLP